MTPVTRTGKPQFQTSELLEGQRLSDLVHTLCHEIDNPLTAIISLGTVMQRFDQTDFTSGLVREKLPFYSEALIEEAWRVNGTAEKLVAIASNRADTANCELNTVLFESLAKLRDKMDYDSINVAVRAPDNSPLVPFDSHQLAILLRELLRNAHEAASRNALDRGEEANIAIQVEVQSDQAVVSISSYNKTSCPRELGELFEPFCRGDERAKGVGLGLTAAWAILERFGGTLELTEQALDSGFLFSTTASLPLGSGEPDKTTSIATGEKPLPETLAVLIIEDEDTIASAIQKILSMLLADKTTVNCECVLGPEALERFRRGEQFDAILCDINLGEISGQDIFEFISTDRPELTARMAFLTGDQASAEVQSFLRSSGCPYLHKPFEPEDLLELVQRLATR